MDIQISFLRSDIKSSILVYQISMDDSLNQLLTNMANSWEAINLTFRLLGTLYVFFKLSSADFLFKISKKIFQKYH